jgi:hypothetical protein
MNIKVLIKFIILKIAPVKADIKKSYIVSKKQFND